MFMQHQATFQTNVVSLSWYIARRDAGRLEVDRPAHEADVVELAKRDDVVDRLQELLQG